MKESYLNELIEKINDLIYKYEQIGINYGGCGMVAVSVSRFLNKLCIPNRIRANYLNGGYKGFDKAEHYSVVISQDLEINKPKFNPVWSMSRSVEDCEWQIFYLENECDYDHRIDLYFMSDLESIRLGPEIN